MWAHLVWAILGTAEYTCAVCTGFHFSSFEPKLMLNCYILKKILITVAALTVVWVKSSSRVSNLSAMSSQSPPIYLQKVSTSRSAGIFKLSPGAGTRPTLRMRSLGVRHFCPSSVFPVKYLICSGINIEDAWLLCSYWSIMLVAACGALNIIVISCLIKELLCQPQVCAKL